MNREIIVWLDNLMLNKVKLDTKFVETIEQIACRYTLAKCPISKNKKMDKEIQDKLYKLVKIYREAELWKKRKTTNE